MANGHVIFLLLLVKKRCVDLGKRQRRVVEHIRGGEAAVQRVHRLGKRRLRVEGMLQGERHRLRAKERRHRGMVDGLAVATITWQDAAKDVGVIVCASPKRTGSRRPHRAPAS